VPKLVVRSMTDLEFAKEREPQLAADETFLAEVLAALLLMTVFTGGVLFALL
jgi:hypothetical protein